MSTATAYSPDELTDYDSMSLEDLADFVYDRRQEASAKQRQVDAIKDVQRAAEAALMGRMEELGTTRAGSARTSVVASDETLPSITDFDAFLRWAIENDVLAAMINRSVKAPAYREALAQGEDVAGVEPFTRRKLSVTKTKTK